MRRPRVKLDNLLAVATVTDIKDYGRAAEELGLSPSAVRKQIETIENVLGVKIFSGKNGNLSLTQDGEVFQADARRSIEYAILAEEKVMMRVALRNHHVHIGHSTDLPPQLIIQIYRVEVAGEPPVHIHHVSGLTAILVRQVVEGSLHAAFVLLPVSTPGLLTRIIFEEPLVACLPSGHRMAGKSVIYPQDLEGEPVIAVAREPFPELHREIEEHFRDFGVALQVVAEAFAPPEAMTLVAQKIGICFVAATSVVSSPGIVVRPLSTKVLVRRIGVVIREDNRSTLVQKLIDAIMDRVRTVRTKT